MTCYRTAVILGFAPDAQLTVSEWADENRFLSQKASAEPGQWRTERTPYLRDIMDSLSVTHPATEVTFSKGAQVGATEAGNNWLGYIIDHTPAPTMFVQPTVELAKRNSKQRIDTLIEESPRLKAKVNDPRSRDSGNTVLSKEFPGGLVIMTGANSAVGLRSMAARFLFLDEIDAFPQDVDDEGSPESLAIARTRTFSRRKIFRASTPTIKNRSRIEAAFEEGSGEYFHVPCPHCGEYQRLVFSNLIWPEGNPDDAQYKCCACEQLIPEHHKTWMLSHGEWWATRPELQDKHRSFHLSSLYSPVGWFSWADIAKQWQASQKDPSRLKVFVNTVLGESWEDRGEAPDWRKLYDRRESYAGRKVPQRGVFVTAGADVQSNRIEVQVRAWGRGAESWLIDYVVLDGNTAEGQPVWTRLTQLLNMTYQHVSGVHLPIVKLGIDSGHQTNAVYQWVRQNGFGRALALDPRDGKMTAIIGQPTAVDVSVGGKKIRRGLQIWPVNTWQLKADFYRALNLDPPTEEDREAGTSYPPGYCHFTSDVANEEFFKQVAAEQMVTRSVKGFPRTEWMKLRDRNEALDTFVYARAVAEIYGLSRFNDGLWSHLESALKPVNAPSRTSTPHQRTVRGTFL